MIIGKFRLYLTLVSLGVCRAILTYHRTVGLRTISYSTVYLNTMRRWKITVFCSLCSALLAHLETLVDIAHVNSLQLELLPTLLIDRRLIAVASDQVRGVHI